MNKLNIAVAGQVTEGVSAKFSFTRGGRPMQGFLTRFCGKLVAYENRCRHLPVTLDGGSGKFFESDGTHFVCQSHGAMYEPLTGLCVRGPCEGESLIAMKLEIKDGTVWLLEAD